MDHAVLYHIELSISIKWCIARITTRQNMCGQGFILNDLRLHKSIEVENFREKETREEREGPGLGGTYFIDVWIIGQISS